METTPASIDRKNGVITVHKNRFSKAGKGFIDVHEINHLIHQEFSKLFDGNNYEQAYAEAKKIVKKKYPKTFKSATEWMSRHKGIKVIQITGKQNYAQVLKALTGKKRKK